MLRYDQKYLNICQLLLLNSQKNRAAAALNKQRKILSNVKLLMYTRATFMSQSIECQNCDIVKRIKE
jgi:hypothetical protein